ncbi:YSC84-related protein [Caulobacter sp. 17J80-11]|uniref:lipid-binding SYLF domain-containing protein n=1 Tax=Caulobacter sp. 17J80-11 TaxID=2763502 RepID=UPI001653D249|nr:lipid-binding SYLF domain-containing protein [Caulobacter sp. 17J80-11]MBC6981251.1 lipid-binding SYLF domain-containing protein [Caulobacter sp. 17J80-11]
MTEGPSNTTRRAVLVTGGAMLALSACASDGGPNPKLQTEAHQALQELESKNPAARAIAGQSRAVLVFPRITRAAFVFGGQGGRGVLFEGGRPAGDYQFTGVTWGFSAGVQAFSYALYFMNDRALASLKDAKGWEFGVGPTVVVVDAGKAAQLSTTTARDDVYAFVWGQQGLMAGVDLQGSKISKVK